MSIDTAAVADYRKPVARVTVYWGGEVGNGLEFYGPGFEDLLETQSNWLYNEYNLIDQLADGITTIPYKWAHCNGYTTISQMRVAPGTAAGAATNQVGWWSRAVCNGSSIFNVQRPLLILSGAPRNVGNITITGDSAYNEYPVDFDVYVRRENLSYVLESVVGNASLSWSSTTLAAANYPDVIAIYLYITKWSVPNATAKISEFSTSSPTVYTNSEIMSLSILEESEIKDATISVGNISSNEIELELNNIDDLYYPSNAASVYNSSIRKNVKIVAELGFDEPGVGVQYVPMGTYYSDDWKISERGTRAATVGRDRMEKLRGLFYAPANILENLTVGDVAELVLESAVLQMDDLTYTIDSRLYSPEFTIPVVFFEEISFFEVLRLLAASCLGRVYIDRSDTLQFLGPVELLAVNYTLTGDDYYERTLPINTVNTSNLISVTTQPLSLLSGTLYTSEILTLTAGYVKEYKIKYKNKPGKDPLIFANAESGSAFTGTTTSVLNAVGGTVTVTCIMGGAFKIEISGSYYDVLGETVIERSDSQSIAYYGSRRYEVKTNPLVQTEEQAIAIADSILALTKDPERECELDWRGNPNVTIGTVLDVPEYNRQNQFVSGKYTVYKNSLKFDGTLRSSLSMFKVVVDTISIQDTDGASPVLVYQDTDTSIPLIMIQG